jgi:hypothetical protein
VHAPGFGLPATVGDFVGSLNQNWYQPVAEPVARCAGNSCVFRYQAIPTIIEEIVGPQMAFRRSAVRPRSAPPIKSALFATLPFGFSGSVLLFVPIH